MSKASKEAAKKKSVAQKAATRAKKLQRSTPETGQLSSGNGLNGSRAAQELFLRATTTIDTATTDADFGSAIELLRQAIRIDPNQADFFVSLATAYAHSEQHDFALAACEMALRLMPEHAVASENRRHALKALGLPENTQIDV